MATAIKKVVVTQDDKEIVEVSVLATAIIEIDKAMQKLLSSGLNEEAIVLLTANLTSTSVGRPAVREVLGALKNLRKEYCTR